MRRILSCAALFALAASTVSLSAYADGCPAGDPATQVAALQSQTDAINNACPTNGGPSSSDQQDCPGKPDESVITAVINCLQPIADSNAAARPKADADLQISTLYGMITQFYRSGLDKQDPGKKSYFALKAATQADATYEQAWITLGQVVDGFSSSGFWDRRGIEIGLGISIGDERDYAIQGLGNLSNPSPQAQQLLQKLKSY